MHRPCTPLTNYAAWLPRAELDRKWATDKHKSPEGAWRNTIGFFNLPQSAARASQGFAYCELSHA